MRAEDGLRNGDGGLRGGLAGLRGGAGDLRGQQMTCAAVKTVCAGGPVEARLFPIFEETGCGDVQRRGWWQARGRAKRGRHHRVATTYQ